jgi:uncharacterized protein (TIGR02246 family)
MMHKVLLPLALSLMVATHGVARAGTPDEPIKAVNQELVKALTTADAPALERLLADDLTFTHGSGTVENKTEVIDALKAGKRKLDTIAQEDIQVRVYGTTAYLTGRANVKGVMGPTKLDQNIRFSGLWVKQKGKWRMSAYQATIVPPPKPTTGAAPAAPATPAPAKPAAK